jgi:hypothetical protein
MGITTYGDDKIVTAVLTLRTDHARHPPDCRMIKEQPFRQRLHQVYQVVAPQNVGEFVQENPFNLRAG